MEKITVKFVEKSELIAQANEFLRTYNKSGKIPVPIEDIVEKELGIRVIPTPGLKRLFGPDSYICVNSKLIIVDEKAYFNGDYRCRFTYAHEVGHFVLHRDVAGFGDIKDVNGYLQFQNALTGKDEQKLEFQAYFFAGYILLPQVIFRAVGEKLIKEAGGMSTLSLADIASICEILSEKFQVSCEVIFRQIKYEFPEIIEKLGKEVR